MSAPRNTPPADAYDVLRRLYACNWNQLAERLGVSPQTLREWRKEGHGKNGAMRLQNLMETGLRASHSEWLLLQTNWDAIATIRGKR